MFIECKDKDPDCGTYLVNLSEITAIIKDFSCGKYVIRYRNSNDGSYLENFYSAEERDRRYREIKLLLNQVSLGIYLE